MRSGKKRSPVPGRAPISARSSIEEMLVRGTCTEMRAHSREELSRDVLTGGAALHTRVTQHSVHTPQHHAGLARDVSDPLATKLTYPRKLSLSVLTHPAVPFPLQFGWLHCGQASNERVLDSRDTAHLTVARLCFPVARAVSRADMSSRNPSCCESRHGPPNTERDDFGPSPVLSQQSSCGDGGTSW